MDFLNIVNAILYYPILIIILIASGLYFTFKTGVIQISLFKNAFSVITETPKKGEVSSFQALMVSTASRVGTGNIVGVSNAICIGGYGAIFWMWIIAIIGSSSAFIESTLAQIYKKKGKTNSYGGPSYYIQTGIGSRTLGLIFAISLILTYAVGFNMLASFNLQDSFRVYSFYNSTTTPWIIGLVLAILAGFCILGGGKRIIKATSILVPIMGIVFILVSLIIVLKNYYLFPIVMKKIFVDAFNFRAIFGGISSSCLVEGIKRGLYSNEAGMGSSPNAAASAKTSHPVKQGLIQTLGVFTDTIIICTCTAFMVLLYTQFNVTSGATSIELAQEALSYHIGSFGYTFIAICIFLFAFSSIVGNYYYGESNIEFIFGENKPLMTGFRVIVIAMVLFGSLTKVQIVWDLADVMMALMAIVNLVAITLLGKFAFRALDDYTMQRKAGIKNPTFNPANIKGLGKVECWGDDDEEAVI